MRFLSTLLLAFLSCFLFAEPPQPNLTLMIPMRDGYELPTDIYFSCNPGEQCPAILIRSPAGRRANTTFRYLTLTQQGYTVVVQDTRSAKDPEGKTLPYQADGWGDLQDGYDTISWLTESPYCNGKIGTAGGSALGMTQLMMAPAAPSALKCQYIEVAASDLFHQAVFPGGQLLKNQVEGWLNLYAKHPDVYKTIASQPIYNDFWTQFNSLPQSHKVHVPGVHLGGWYDIFIQGTIDAFKARQENGGEGAKGTQKLIIGPWTHYWPYKKNLGDYEVPLAGQKLPYELTPETWFDHYLKNANNGVDQMPSVLYYVMGPFDGTASSGNKWKTAEQWPVSSQETPLYLSKDKELSFIKPVAKHSYSYLHDPQNPIPTLGGRNLFLESGPKDQGSIEKRADVITFTSPILEEDLEITGRVLAKLFIASDQGATDVSMLLTDVYPDGKSLLIADGFSHIVGNLKEVEVDLWSTSFVFTKGHRIRVSISSSNYPRYQVNPEKTKNEILVGPYTPSRILLPLVRNNL